MQGWSEAELAEKAGLAARTVRLAESGAPVKHHVAYDVASALEVGVKDLILDLAELAWVELDRVELHRRLSWQAIAAACEAALDGAVSGADFTPFVALAHPHLVLRCEATSLLPFCGEFHGHEGVTAYADRIKRWFEERRIVERRFVFERIERDGEVLFMRGKYTLLWENGATGDFGFAHFIRVKEDRIVVFEQFIGM